VPLQRNRFNIREQRGLRIQVSLVYTRRTAPAYSVTAHPQHTYIHRHGPVLTPMSRAGCDHKDKRPKFVMSPRTQGLVNNTHHGKKRMLMTCTHDRMIGGKAAKRSNSGDTAKKKTFLDETNHAVYLSPLMKTIEVGGFPPWRPKCHTTVVTPTKMECSTMIIIDKRPNNFF